MRESPPPYLRGVGGVGGAKPPQIDGRGAVRRPSHLVYIYIYTLDETCPYTGTEVCMNPQGKLQSKIVDMISKLRHPVVKVSIADNDSKIRQRQ